MPRADRRARRPPRALLFTVALAAAAGLAAFVYLGSRSAHDRQELDGRLREADDALSLGYLDRAGERIHAAAETARSERDWLRVLKRALQLARGTGDHRPLAGLAERAVDRIGGSPRLRLVAAWALLRAEQPDRAFRHLDGRWRSAPFRREPLAAGLWAEALLRAGAGEEEGKGLPDDFLALLRVEHIREPEELSALARRFEEPRFSLDAALLAMRLGRPQEAFRLMGNAPGGHLEPAFLIAYDAGEDGTALERLQDLLTAPPAGDGNAQRPDLRAMLGDLLVLNDDPGGAAEVYLALAREAPDFSWKPFLSLAALLERGGTAGPPAFTGSGRSTAIPANDRCWSA